MPTIDLRADLIAEDDEGRWSSLLRFVGCCSTCSSSPATVAEMAVATGRPPSSVAYHVGVLADAGLLKVVITRRIRGVVERTYGRTARIFYVGQTEPGVDVPTSNPLHEAGHRGYAGGGAGPSAIAAPARPHPARPAGEFWNAVMELAQDFSASVRSGSDSYAFVAALYPRRLSSPARAGGATQGVTMSTSSFTIKPLDLSTWDAFAALVEANGGIFGGCWCMGMHPDDRTHLDASQPHREQKLDRVRAGSAHAALVFDGNTCVGWCQFGPPDEVMRIKNRKQYEHGLDELPAWRIGCCFVGKGHRRRGVATAALAGALELIAELGGGRVEGYPEPAADVPAGFLYHGVLSTFERAGFRKDRQIGKHRWVVSTDVRPAEAAERPRKRSAR